MADDDDFWETYIPATPDEDKDFAPLGKLLLIVGAIIAAAIVIVAILR
jgi:hypothetical protein